MNVAVEERLRKIISAKADVSFDTVTLTATPEDLEIDSLTGAHIILAVEDAFEIEIPDEKTYRFKTVESLLNYVLDAMSKKR